MLSKNYLPAILLLVTSIIGVIVCIWLSMNAYSYERYQQMTTLANAKKLSQAVGQYVVDNDGCLPPKLRAAKDLLKNDLPPSSFKTFNPNGGEFLLNPRDLGVRIAQIPRSDQVLVVFESELWPDGRRAVGFLDGHAELVRRFDEGLLPPPRSHD